MLTKTINGVPIMVRLRKKSRTERTFTVLLRGSQHEFCNEMLAKKNK